MVNDGEREAKRLQIAKGLCLDELTANGKCPVGSTSKTGML